MNDIELTGSKLEAHPRLLGTLVELGAAMCAAGLDTRTILEEAARHLATALSDECVVHELIHSDEPMSTFAYRMDPITLTAQHIDIRDAEMLEHQCRSLLRTKRPRLSSYGSSNSAEAAAGGQLIVPIMARGEAMGTLTVRRSRPTPYSQAEQAMVQAAADQAALCVWNARRYQELQRERKRLEDFLQRTPAAELGERAWLHLRDGAPTQPVEPGHAPNRDQSGQEALRSSRWLLSMVFDSLPSIVFIKDVEGRYLFVNKRYLQATNLQSAEQCWGRTDRELYPLEVAEYFETIDRDVISSGKSIQSEDKFFMEGEWRVFMAIKYPLRDPSGQIFGVAGIATEITERKHVEHSLQSGQEQLRFVTDALPALVSFIAAEGGFRFVNKAYEDWFGAPRNEMLGKSLEELFGETARDAIIPQFERALNGQPCSFDTRIQHAELGMRDVHVSYVAQHELTQRIEGVVALIIDLTEQRRSEERVRFLADAGRVLGSSLDHRTTVEVVCNQAVQRLVDVCAVVVSGQMDPIVASSDTARLTLARSVVAALAAEPAPLLRVERLGQLQRALLHEQITDAWLDSQVESDEQRQLLRALGLNSMIIAPLSGRQERSGIVLLASASGSRTLEGADLALAEELANSIGFAAENAALYSQAQQAVRLRDDFLSIAGHELKTPLTALSLDLGRLGLELEGSGGQGTETQFSTGLQKALRNLERLEHLILELLDVSRLSTDALRLSPVAMDLGRRIRAVVEAFQEHAKQANCELRLDLPRQSIQGHWDPLRLDQVISNLMSNALKYGAGKPIQVSLKASGSRATICVADHGIGIPAVDRERIFTRFERAVSRENYGGLGLGLWIARQFVEAMGGTISVESEPGRGSRFCVELPIEANVS